MSSIAGLAETGALVGEPARTAMLVTLMDGRALTASELARASGIMPATASGHLARLVDGGLIVVAVQGRHRYFRLASPAVAQMIESMMSVTGVVDAARRTRPIRSGPAEQSMRRARQCYDHLAGEVAVQIADFLAGSSHLEWSAEAASMTPTGIAFLERLGLDLGGGLNGLASDRRQRAYCRPCMDWSERRPHIAGAVGRSLFQFFLDRRWMRRDACGRAVFVTPRGTAALRRHFGVR